MFPSHDPSTQLIDDYLLGLRLRASTTVKEAATLGAGRQKSMYETLEKSLSSSDIPKTVESFIKKYQLPKESALKSGMRFQKILNDATIHGHKNVPAFQEVYDMQDQKSDNDNIPIEQMSQEELERIARGG